MLAGTSAFSFWSVAREVNLRPLKEVDKWRWLRHGLKL
jgi:hypothetical protein